MDLDADCLITYFYKMCPVGFIVSIDYSVNYNLCPLCRIYLIIVSYKMGGCLDYAYYMYRVQ